VLHPSRPWIALGDLRVTLAANVAVETDRDRGRTGRAFVEAQDDLGDVAFQVRLRAPVE
jgi:hypothetical protein